MTHPQPPQDPSSGQWQQPVDYPGLPQPPQYPVQPYAQQPYPPAPSQQQVARPTSAWAIASVVLSSLAILSGLAVPCIAPIALGIMGAAAGHAAEHETRRGTRTGRPLALIGIVAGWTAPLSSFVLLAIVASVASG